MRNPPATPSCHQAFQRHYTGEIPMCFLRWEWNDTFNRWSALVLWYDGTRCYTYPCPSVSIRG